MKATDIINVAREQIKVFVAYEVRSLYLMIAGGEPDFENDEEYVLEVSGVPIRVEVDNSYLDIEDICYEYRDIKEIHLALDGEIYIVCDGDDDTEIVWGQLGTDEMVGISNVLETCYNELMKK